MMRSRLPGTNPSRRISPRRRGGEELPRPSDFRAWGGRDGQGGPYRVYTPYWKAVRGRDVAPCASAKNMAAPAFGPSEDLELADGQGDAARCRSSRASCRWARAARARLGTFLERAAAYKADRDFRHPQPPACRKTSLTARSPRARSGTRAGRRLSAQGLRDPARRAEHFVKELVWREFAWHLLYHYPDLRPNAGSLIGRVSRGAARAKRPGMASGPHR